MIKEAANKATARDDGSDEESGSQQDGIRRTNNGEGSSQRPDSNQASERTGGVGSKDGLRTTTTTNIKGVAGTPTEEQQ